MNAIPNLNEGRHNEYHPSCSSQSEMIISDPSTHLHQTELQVVYKQLVEQQTHVKELAKEKENLHETLKELAKKYEEAKCALKVLYNGMIFKTNRGKNE
jgi:predicted nuclease with TOPRIM domain